MRNADVNKYDKELRTILEGKDFQNISYMIKLRIGKKGPFFIIKIGFFTFLFKTLTKIDKFFVEYNNI